MRKKDISDEVINREGTAATSGRPTEKKILRKLARQHGQDIQ